MAIFDSIEELFQQWRNYSENAKALVTFATAFGTLFIIYYAIKSVFELIDCFRLYVWSQLCAHSDYVKKYGKWAVISGATDGIGLQMSKELARRGHSLVIIGRNEEKLSSTKASLEEEPNVGQVITVKSDLSDSSVANFEKIQDQIKPDELDIGILINNVGVFPSKTDYYHTYSMEYIRTITNTNILATLYLTKIIVPGMLNRQKGLIVNVSSGMGDLTVPYMCTYPATKAFINSFSRLLQSEYDSLPIDIINLSPGAVYTKLFTGLTSIEKPYWFMAPTAEDYAKSSLNALSTRIKSFTGTIIHELQAKFTRVPEAFGLTPLLFRLAARFFVKDYQLSPIHKTKPSDMIQTSESTPAAESKPLREPDVTHSKP